jgi:hypothetical protein
LRREENVGRDELSFPKIGWEFLARKKTRSKEK